MEIPFLIGFILGLILTIAWIVIPFVLLGINKKAQRILKGLQIMEEHLRTININISNTTGAKEKTE